MATKIHHFGWIQETLDGQTRTPYTLCGIPLPEAVEVSEGQHEGTGTLCAKCVRIADDRRREKIIRKL